MKRLAIAVLATLALLAQNVGGAWAAAGMDLPVSDERAVQSAAAMPCHGDAGAPASEAPDPSAPCDCCDAYCALACGFIAMSFYASAIPALPHAGPPVDSSDAPSLLAAHTASPFRPPAA
ncbi:MAG TPA: hypothetical protein VM240_00155 [Verrucomicrobiae bacterium]|nr:hypothetical protein [Verrucomicrobiae bacterium]